MTKKRTTKKQQTDQPQQTAEARDGIAVAGGIHAGRDVIMGDQYNDFRQGRIQILGEHQLTESSGILSQDF